MSAYPRSQFLTWFRGCLLSLFDWLVAQTKHPGLVGFRIHQLKPGLLPFLKETLSLPQDQGSNTEVVLIDEVMLCEQLNQVRASVDQENPTGLRFQLRYFFRDIACDDMGVVPGDISQSAGDDVLGNAIKAVGHVPRSAGPGRCHFLVGLAPEEHRVGLLERGHDILPDFLIYVLKH